MYRHSKRIELTLATTLTAVGFGCATNEPIQDSAMIERVRNQLVVVPVFTDGPTSGFPIAPRLVVSAAHCIGDYPSAVVAGYPTRPVMRREFALDSRCKPEDDWVVLAAKRDRWIANEIGRDTELKPGDTVFMAGYPANDSPNDAVKHIAATPTIVMGTVKSPRWGDPPGFVRVAAPWKRPHGMSGGPVATLGDDGRVRVVGVLSRVYFKYCPFERECEIGFAKPSNEQWEAALTLSD